jgi:predicted metal-dependent phosphoesterase TrpH
MLNAPHKQYIETLTHDNILRVDLHCHSTASDGFLSPSELVERASSKGVKVLALTDHDTIDGLEEGHHAAHDLNIKLINGIEFSSEWEGHNIHIVGLNFDVSSTSMQQALSHQKKARVSRAELIAERLFKKTGCELLNMAYEKAGGHVPGRPHFAVSLIEQGFVRDFNEAFGKYLGAGKIGDVRAFWPEISQIVEWINNSKGIAVLAHPRKYKMTGAKLRKLLDLFCAAGGRGMEVLTSGQKQGDTGLLYDLCRHYQLKASVGSDFHHPRFPWTDFGQLTPLPSFLEPVWLEF